MRAALLPSYGDADRFVIEDVEKPQPAAGEILVRIEASAVNPFDLLVRQGFMAQYIPLPLPAILGGDAAGTVAAVGADVSGYAVGDRVIADFATNGKGAHAEFGVVPASAVAPLPDNLSFEQGAALPKAGLTGRQTVEALGVKAGDRVLVSGGLGSVGRAAIQYLQEIGVHPVAGIRADRLDEAAQMGVEALDIGAPATDASFAGAISTVASVAGNLVSHVRDGGQVASIVPVPDDLNPDDRVVIHQLYHRTDATMLAAAAQAASAGRLVIPIAQTLPLEKLSAAHEAVAAGARGKIVLRH